MGHNKCFMTLLNQIYPFAGFWGYSMTQDPTLTKLFHDALSIPPRIELPFVVDEKYGIRLHVVLLQVWKISFMLFSCLTTHCSWAVFIRKFFLGILNGINHICPIILARHPNVMHSLPENGTGMCCMMPGVAPALSSLITCTVSWSHHDMNPHQF